MKQSRLSWRLSFWFNNGRDRERERSVPFNIRLDRLHLTIQAAMGWTNSHLYEIRAAGVGWSTPYPDQDWAGDFLDARKARLGDVLEDVGTKMLKYLYDFGDGWEHTIKVERLVDPEPGVLYPRLIEAKGRCPPEDCRRSLGLWRVHCSEAPDLILANPLCCHAG
jgi:hypothetical protein